MLYSLTGSEQGRINTNGLTTLGLLGCPKGISQFRDSPTPSVDVRQSIPLLPGRNIFNTSFQEDPIVVQLFGSLVEVSSIRRQGCFGGGDNGRARRPREPRDKFCKDRCKW